MAIVEAIVALGWLAYRVCEVIGGSESDSTSVSKPKRIVTLVGRTSGGKSSLGNALVGRPVFEVGVEHGTTRRIDRYPIPGGYFVQDTPGVLDSDEGITASVWSALEASQLVVYVSDGQLYRQELEIVKQMVNAQCDWDSKSGTPHLRRMALFVNKRDIRENSVPRHVRDAEIVAIHSQVKELIPPERIAFGSASPNSGAIVNAAEISDVHRIIREMAQGARIRAGWVFAHNQTSQSIDLKVTGIVDEHGELCTGPVCWKFGPGESALLATDGELIIANLVNVEVVTVAGVSTWSVSDFDSDGDIYISITAQQLSMSR